MLGESHDAERPGMIRVLLILAIAVPILIEVVTFGGLIGHYVGVGGGDPSGAATATPTETSEDTGSAVLPETPQTERIERARLLNASDGRQLIVTLSVQNQDRTGYELRLDNVTTGAGTTVDGSGSTTGTVDGVETGTVTGSWLLPAGERPETMTVTAVTDPEGSTPNERTYTVPLDEVSFEGS